MYYSDRKVPIFGFERSKRAVNQGYFRDAYNNGSILWKYGLSWWTDVNDKLVNKKGVMSVANVKKFRKLLDDSVFDNNIVGESDDDIKYFNDGRKLLKEYLDFAIDNKIPIDCSL